MNGRKSGSGKSDKSNVLIGDCSNLTKSKKRSNLTKSKSSTKSNYIIGRSNFLTPNVRTSFTQLR